MLHLTSNEHEIWLFIITTTPLFRITEPFCFRISLSYGHDADFSTFLALSLSIFPLHPHMQDPICCPVVKLNKGGNLYIIVIILSAF